MFPRLERTDLELACRRASVTRYLGDNTALTRVLDTFNMFVDTRDRSIAPHLMVDGYWEMWLTGAVVNFVQTSMRCIDVGANLGYYTLLLAELVGEHGLVQAFEPNKRLADLLLDSVKMNGYGSIVDVRDFAAGAEEYKATLSVESADMGGGKVSEHGQKGVPVEVVPLDEYGGGLAYDFIKIDVEGYEGRVWSGMPRIIENSPNLNVMMEFDPNGLERVDGPGAAQDLLLEIQASGMKLHSVTTTGQIVPVSAEEAVKPDTGTHRTLWLRR